MTMNIVVAGPRGRMGSEALKMIQQEEQFSLTACIDRTVTEETKKEVKTLTNQDIPLYSDIEECLQEVKADVLIDLTVSEPGFIHTKAALQHKVRAVVGTSGFSDEQIEELSSLAKENKTGCIIAPNFALGAVLMMQFAKTAARYFPDVEVIEKHHDQKIDAPSGTAKKTVELIQEERKEKEQGHPDEYETYTGARGADIGGVHVHSMRLPGLVAHQEVVFGSTSQLLTIQHDSFHRESFMEGLKLAVQEVENYEELVYGLEHVMGL
ncbi:MAG TPA: 4-hydroxy-tetrahydrodipicolinate reductase [Pseudogracilibacillus sp.]|nr:4-hydroxy-tetrahydrodipicolinate reductase [Pseudogracilibacillus sp.]